MYGVYIKRERDWWEFFKKLFLLLWVLAITVGLSCLDIYARGQDGVLWSHIQAFFRCIGGGDTIFFAGYTTTTLLTIKIARNTIVFIDTFLAVVLGILVGVMLFVLEWYNSGLFCFYRLFFGIAWGSISQGLEKILDYV